MLQKNELITLTITSATAEGSGVGRTDDGIAVFVPQSAVGDTLTVRILKVKKTYAFGKIEAILTPAASRIEPDCPQFRQCGGCVWRHISYKEECRLKEQKVIDAITRTDHFERTRRPLPQQGAAAAQPRQGREGLHGLLRLPQPPRHRLLRLRPAAGNFRRGHARHEGVYRRI